MDTQLTEAGVGSCRDSGAPLPGRRVRNQQPEVGEIAGVDGPGVDGGRVQEGRVNGGEVQGVGEVVGGGGESRVGSLKTTGRWRGMRGLGKWRGGGMVPKLQQPFLTV